MFSYNELISVIVPVYNVKEYLKACVKSIIGQTYKNLEILLIDDGSTDGSGELCDLLEREDRRIIVYHKENGGLSDARNYGLEKANGEYYSFIDSDDAIHKDYFLEMMKALKQTNSDIASCGMIHFSKPEQLVKLHEIKHLVQSKVYSKEAAIKEYLAPKNKRVIYPSACMKIYKKEIFDKIRFEKGKLHEDLFITHRLLDQAESLVYVDAPYYFYFQRHDSIMHSYGKKNLIDELEAINQIKEYFRDRKEFEDALKCFTISEYLEKLEKIGKMEKDSFVKSKMSEMISYVKQNINHCYEYNIIRRSIIFALINKPNVYVLFRKARQSVDRKLKGKNEWI